MKKIGAYLRPVALQPPGIERIAFLISRISQIRLIKPIIFS
jgi:hypothetical protein